MSRLSTIILVSAAAILFVAAGRQNTRLAESRYHIQPAQPTENRSKITPCPAPVVTVALAGFRCLAADLLWLRAADLQDKGRYFELVQLAEWITTLEPHFTEVWAIHAWNMAYNISIMMPENSDRWRWITNGIKLLRDRGIPNNRDNPYLYTELGYIFFDKIGTSSDPSTQYFKIEWAKEMIALLGENGCPDYKELNKDKAALELMQEYKLQPQRMQEIDRIYGPLDWRVPQTHSLYWAYLGNNATGTNIHNTVCDRMIYQSMAAIFDHGKLTCSKDGEVFVTSSNFDLLPKVISTFEETLRLAPNETTETAFANFLASASRTLKFYHQDKKARELFNKLHHRFPSPETQQGFENFTQHASPRMPQILSPDKGL
jgi:hypothetical protein